MAPQAPLQHENKQLMGHDRQSKQLLDHVTTHELCHSQALPLKGCVFSGLKLTTAEWEGSEQQLMVLSEHIITVSPVPNIESAIFA